VRGTSSWFELHFGGKSNDLQNNHTIHPGSAPRARLPLAKAGAPIAVNLSHKEACMPKLVKAGIGNEQHYFDCAALKIVLFTAEMNGWNHDGHEPEVFDRENSEEFCGTLEEALSEIEESISPMDEDEDCICNDCYFNRLVKEHQMELIEEFLWFCQGQPFRIACEH